MFRFRLEGEVRAAVLEEIGRPLIVKEVSRPLLKEFEVLIKIHVCGVCRTDLHIIEGELPKPRLPLILGHQIVGVVEELGPGASKHQIGKRVGAPWLGGCCNACEFCLSERENLCDQGVYTGYHSQGGYAEYCAVHEDFLVEIPKKYSDESAAPLLCAGLIGYRAFQAALPFEKIGFYGFGSSAHLLIQVAQYLKKQVYVFTRPGDRKTQEFARSLGAFWAGGSDETSPELLDSAIIFAPVGALFPQALKSIKKGGRVVSAGIHMSDIPSFEYSLLWGERSISSVANLTRKDGVEFMKMAQKIGLHISVKVFSLNDVNQALKSVKNGSFNGSIVLKI